MEQPHDNDIEQPKDTELPSEDSFKKPVFVGKVQRKGPLLENAKHLETNKPESSSAVPSQELRTTETPTENSIPLPYIEPKWSGLPTSSDKDYNLEVLKNGTIIERLDLMSRSFSIFGRLTNCNICMQHPTISRYHAVLQYRPHAEGNEEPGFYVYDLGSTHGTFLNKRRLKPKVYARVQVGHMLKLGCSTRSYILGGPEGDAEQESTLSVTELKEKRAAKIREHEEAAANFAKLAAIKAESKKEEQRKAEESRGVDWGLGEDAEEESDLSENPYAQSNNEELYLDDPKKALRGFFEREGLDLEYNCNEQGLGQFLCKVELPVDDEMGRAVVAEVLHKGKKKEAVVQCALEACRILDRHGVLRQAVHESRKRKAKNWEENDYYDSDDDTFLDRTGTIEKKREMRIQSKQPQKAETYESLVEQERKLSESIAKIERQLRDAQLNQAKATDDNEDDSLDSYMKELKQPMTDKKTIIKLNMEVVKLKTEHARVVRLANIAKPASLPPLVSQYMAGPSTSRDVGSRLLPAYGKRLKVKMQLNIKPNLPHANKDLDDDEDVEEESEGTDIKETEIKPEEKESVSNESAETETQTGVDVEDQEAVSSDDEDEIEATGTISSLHNSITFKKFEKLLSRGLPPFVDKHQEKLEKILKNLKKLASSEDRMQVDWKMLAAKKRKVLKLISDLRTCEPNEKLEHKVSSELTRILQSLNTMTEQKYKVIEKVKKMGNDIRNISQAIDKDLSEYKKEVNGSFDLDAEEDNAQPGTSSGAADEENSDKKKKKNLRRIQHRQERAVMDRQRGYEEDATRDDYNMWVPPSDQVGDGRTTLNDKFGY